MCGCLAHSKGGVVGVGECSQFQRDVVLHQHGACGYGRCRSAVAQKGALVCVKGWASVQKRSGERVNLVEATDCSLRLLQWFVVRLSVGCGKFVSSYNMLTLQPHRGTRKRIKTHAASMHNLWVHFLDSFLLSVV